MCVACYVDEAMKQKIIAYNAEFHEVTRSPYGKDDEIGMLNLIDAQSRSAILGRRRRCRAPIVHCAEIRRPSGLYCLWSTGTKAGPQRCRCSAAQRRT